VFIIKAKIVVSNRNKNSKADAKILSTRSFASSYLNGFPPWEPGAPGRMLLLQGEVWWNKESEILNSHLKCFSLEKHIGVRRKEATVNHATSYEILCEK